MDAFLPLLLTRRSVRRYTGEPIPPEALRAVLTAGLLSPSSRSRRPWELVVVQDRATLEALSHCRQGSANMLAGAGAAILVFARPSVSDVWTEDCAIVLSNLHLAAHSLGLGSCWIHRAREVFDSPEGQALLHQWGLEGTYAGVGHCILGYPAADLPPAPPRKPGRVVRV